MKSKISRVRVVGPFGVRDVQVLVVSFDEVPLSVPVALQAEYLLKQAHALQQHVYMLLARQWGQPHG